MLSHPENLPEKLPDENTPSPRSVTHQPSSPYLLAVTTTGDLTYVLSTSAQILERYRSGAQTSLILNRPSSLHALSPHMVLALSHRLAVLERGPTRVVLLLAAPAKRPAFCSGGDIREMHALLTAGCISDVDAFFRKELMLNSRMARMQTPVVCIMDGYTMGGGAGLAAQCRFRVATENTVFAMPECAIGLLCDVGSSYFLPRLKPAGLGMYLALTGQRLRGEGVRAAGFATHFVNKGTVAALVERLEISELRDAEEVEAVLREFCVKEEGTVGVRERVLRECFIARSVAEIQDRLRAVIAGDDEEDSAFARDALARIRKGCPMSVKVVFEAQRRGAHTSLDKCLRMEFRLLTRFIRREDFWIGVDSMVISKDKNPAWRPSRLEEVSADDVERLFAPLSADLGIAELDEGGLGLAQGEKAVFYSRL